MFSQSPVNVLSYFNNIKNEKRGQKNVNYKNDLFEPQ